jgi:alkaline phosphatase D
MKRLPNPRTCLLLAALSLPAIAQTGPMVGTVKTTEAYFLYRPGAVEKPLRLSVLDANQQVVATSATDSDDANDYVAKFHVTGLTAGTAYTYKVEDVSGASPVELAGPADGLRFKTRQTTGTKGVVTTAFVSCANSSSEPVWERIGTLRPDQLILGGDTPYVDVADLATSRTKHRAFLETPFMSSLIRSTSAVGTWDDHDFGLNNGNGVNAADRRANTRQAFTEYRAHDQFGTGIEGVYHKVELGVMEIFLLDPRWWSQTGPSPVDPSKKTAFGSQQWAWIQQALEASRAPFKVLAMGQIWEDKKNGENDDMFTYWYERDALYDFIRSKSIPGVVVLGGDIHVSRHLIHRQRIGYDLHDFVISPAHTSVIPSLDVTHPDLEWSSQQPRQFMTLTADSRANPPVLTARYYLADGTIQRELTIPYEQLTPKEGAGLGRGLRAWWSFDGDFENQTVLGGRFHAAPENGAALVADGGLRGGAASFARAAQQYLRIGRQTLDDTPPLPERAGRSPLDDNGAAHTLSLWCKPASLPAHGSADRHFLLESALGGSADPGYVMSAGFRSAATDANKINLELHTVTIQPAGSASTAQPTPLAQGPFACELDRSLFTGRWAHVAITFDSTHLRLYVDGTEVAAHVLPNPGPAAETGGLVIGGHRTGTGRNYDGLLDEIALWSRALTPAEITGLHHSGSPQALPTEVSAADSDGDTLEDWWEGLVGLDLDNPADALADADNDSVPAWLERAAGTHPQTDDSAMYDYLRTLADPGSAPAPLVFRHPSQGTLSLQLTGQQSGDLFDWSPLASGPGVTGDLFSGDFLFTINPPPPAPWFFRLGTEP